MKTAEELAEEHWETYVKIILELHEDDVDLIRKIGVHYNLAFIHGFKHCARVLEVVREFVLSRRNDIEKDMENFGMLKPVLNHLLEETE